MVIIWCNGWCCDGEKFEMVIEIVGIKLRLEWSMVVRDWDL